MQQRGDGLIGLSAELLMVFDETAVAVPRLADAVVTLDVAHAALGETTREEDVVTDGCIAISGACGFAFAFQVKGIRRGTLHAES